MVKDILYYWLLGHPFRCTKCHTYGHVVKDYDKVFFKIIWWKDILDNDYGQGCNPIEPIDPIDRDDVKEKGLELHGSINILKENVQEIFNCSIKWVSLLYLHLLLIHIKFTILLSGWLWKAKHEYNILTKESLNPIITTSLQKESHD